MCITNPGMVSDFEMLRTFNCGVGMVVIVDPVCVNELLQLVEGDIRVVGAVEAIGKEGWCSIDKEGQPLIPLSRNFTYAIIKLGQSGKQGHTCHWEARSLMPSAGEVTNAISKQGHNCHRQAKVKMSLAMLIESTKGIPRCSASLTEGIRLSRNVIYAIVKLGHSGMQGRSCHRQAKSLMPS